jgi:PiT family inorganic phosphate transporter
VGVGLVQGMEKIQFKTVQTIALAWLGTIPLCAALAALLVRIGMGALQLS